MWPGFIDLTVCVFGARALGEIQFGWKMAKELKKLGDYSESPSLTGVAE